jgi:hypothetical protein
VISPTGTSRVRFAGNPDNQKGSAKGGDANLANTSATDAFDKVRRGENPFTDLPEQTSPAVELDAETLAIIRAAEAASGQKERVIDTTDMDISSDDPQIRAHAEIAMLLNNYLDVPGINPSAALALMLSTLDLDQIEAVRQSRGDYQQIKKALNDAFTKLGHEELTVEQKQTLKELLPPETVEKYRGKGINIDALIN